VLRARIATTKEEVVAFLGTGANLAVLIYVAISFVDIFLAPPVIRQWSIVEFMRILTGALLYFAMAYHIHRTEHLEKIIDALVLVAGLMSLLGLYDLSMSQRVVFNPKTMGDHQLFGAFLMVLFPITIMAALTQPDMRRQIAARVVAALTAVCLLMTGTRSAWIGAAVEILALVGFSLIATRNKRQGTDRKQYLIPVLIILTCGGLFIAMGGLTPILNRFGASSARESLLYRQEMWHGATELIKQKPLQGHGLGSYPVLQEQYSGNGRKAVDVINSFPSLGEMAHNFWYQTTAEQGLIGSFTFAAILITFLIAGVRRLRFLDAGVRRYLLLASMAAVLGFSVDAIANPGWQFAQISMYLWLMLGLGVSCLRPRHGR
jgi:O-antigen ligase